jgi:acyl-CoA reductase-like NAD-dependent aldehyde dehydrogenase
VAIVLDDVDVDDVAPKIFAAATLNAGQVCMAAKRIYAPRAIYRKLCEALAKLARDAVVGNGLEPETSIGPIQNRVQYEKLLDLIEDAGRSGTIMAGGQRLNRKGFFIAPTVVADLVDTDRLVTEEQFGPVIPVLAYDTIDEVITRANVSEFGLGGTVWGKDIDRAIAVASQIETGTVWVNKHLDLRFDVPFGGIKQSGLGREQGEDGLREFTQARIINVQK